MARPAQGDHTTGLALLGAILAALRSAERTGEGQVVETSLFETAIWTQASDFGTTAIDRAPVRRRARHNMLSPTANRYPCGDGKWLVVNMLDAMAFDRFCRAIGREDWLEDERFREARGRYDHMPELVTGIDATLATRSRDEWGRIFDEAGLIWGPVLTLDEAAGDGQAHAIGMFPELEHPEYGTYRTVNAPFRFRSGEVRPRGTSPGPGEHTREVLGEMDFDEAEIDALMAAGVLPTHD